MADFRFGLGIVVPMANREHFAKLGNGVETWNAWRLSGAPVSIDLSGASLEGMNLNGFDFSMVNLNDARLFDADLSRANFSGAQLRRADFTESRIAAAVFSRAVLFEANLSQADLTGSDLSEAEVYQARLVHATLTHANLTKAKLAGSDLAAAYLLWADLSHADLSYADLRLADLTQANLTGSNLAGATFGDSNLDGADFKGATLGASIFANVDLAQSKGLDMCGHIGPSSIGLDTLFKSRGKISQVFLRGCGVPEELITFARSLTTKAVEFYSCFISFSTEDQAFADRLYADLQNKGVRCWFAPHHIQGGRKIHEQIDEAVRAYDRVLLIVSEHSMESRWVKTEIANARKKERVQQRQVLFPIRLVNFEAIRPWKLFDAGVGDDSAAEVREYFIPDFSNWQNPDSYRDAFERLLRDLKAERMAESKAPAGA